MKKIVATLSIIICPLSLCQEFDLEQALTHNNKVSTCKYQLADIVEVKSCDNSDLRLIEQGAGCARAYIRDDPNIYLLFQLKKGKANFIIRVFEATSGESVLITSGCPL